MKKILIAIALFATSAFAGERQITNPDLNGDIKIVVNKSGTATEAMLISGTTGALTFGASVTDNSTGQAAVFNGGINAGGTGTTDQQRVLLLNSNTYNGNAYARARAAGVGGVSLVLTPRSSDSVTALSFNANIAADGATTSPVTIGSATQAGAWTLGNPTGAAVQSVLTLRTFGGGTGGTNYLTVPDIYGLSLMNEYSTGETIFSSNSSSTATTSGTYAKRTTSSGSSALVLGIADARPAFAFAYSPAATSSGTGGSITSSNSGFWTTNLGFISTAGAWTLGSTTNAGATTHQVYGGFDWGDNSAYRAKYRHNGSTPGIAVTSGIYDITVGTQTFGILNIACNNSVSGSAQSAKLVHWVAGGGTSSAAVNVVSVVTQGTAPTYTVSSPSAGVIRLSAFSINSVCHYQTLGQAGD